MLFGALYYFSILLQILVLVVLSTVIAVMCKKKKKDIKERKFGTSIREKIAADSPSAASVKKEFKSDSRKVEKTQDDSVSVHKKPSAEDHKEKENGAKKAAEKSGDDEGKTTEQGPTLNMTNEATREDEKIHLPKRTTSKETEEETNTNAGGAQTAKAVGTEQNGGPPSSTSTMTGNPAQNKH